MLLGAQAEVRKGRGRIFECQWVMVGRGLKLLLLCYQTVTCRGHPPGGNPALAATDNARDKLVA